MIYSWFITYTCTPALLSLFPSSLNPSEEMELSLALSSDPLLYKNFKISRALQLLNDKDFDANSKTVIFIHGYMDYPVLPISRSIVNLYLNMRDHNIIVFDTKNEELGIYFRAVNRAPEVGRKLGTALSDMYFSGFDISSLEIIGHSLGTHIAGFAAKTFYQLTNVKPPTIIALDPAGPCFLEGNENTRLSRDDADFVQVIHSNAGYLGIVDPIGHVDIYVNGGKIQPECGMTCSHLKVILYWISAVKNPSGFIAERCPNLSEAVEESCGGGDTVIMGPEMDRDARGIYHLKTSADEPFFV